MYNAEHTPLQIYNTVYNAEDLANTAKKNYERLTKRIKDNADYIFYALPSFKNVIDEIEVNDNQDGEPLYQGIEAKRCLRECNYLKNHASEIGAKICSYLAERYGTLFEENLSCDNSRFVILDEGDVIIVDACRALNSAVWQNEINEDVPQRKL